MCGGRNKCLKIQKIRKIQKNQKNPENIFNKLKEICEGILSILKLISLIMPAFSIIIGFVFAMTYMRDNGFFSYEIFSINFMWVFLLVGMLLIVIHGFYILGAHLRITKKTDGEAAYITCIFINTTLIICVFLACCCILYDNVVFIDLIIIYFLALLIVLSIAYCACYYKKQEYMKKILWFAEIMYIIIFIAFFYYKGLQGVDSSFIVFAIFFFLFEALIIFISCAAITIERFFVALGIMFIAFHILLLSLSVPIFSQFFEESQYYSFNFICKKILKSINLASDNVEIYLKDKNESIISGRLIFDDGKYAYVEFNRTVSNCSGIGAACEQTLIKKVPSEDVSIIVSSKKQQDKKSETKRQEVK